MSVLTQNFTTTLEIYVCCHEGCGVTFGMTSGFVAQRREDHGGWYCPNGHAQYFSAINEKEQLKKENESLQRQVVDAWRVVDEKKIQIQQLGYSLRSQKAAKTAIMNRVKRGLCPCCRRTFSNLQSHFKTQHPELLTVTTP